MKRAFKKLKRRTKKGMKVVQPISELFPAEYADRMTKELHEMLIYRYLR